MLDATEEGLSLIAGPAELEPPFSSVALAEIAEYAPDSIVQALVSLPGIRIVHAEEPDWWHWRATYQTDGADLQLCMSLYETETPLFCSFDLAGLCEAEEAVVLLQHLKAGGFPCLWYHNADTELFTVQGFLQRYS